MHENMRKTTLIPTEETKQMNVKENVARKKIVKKISTCLN